MFPSGRTSLLVVLLGAGCGSEGPAAPDAPLVTVREFVTGVTRHKCEAALACCDRYPYGIEAPDLDGCVEKLLRGSAPTIEEWEQAVAEGAVIYDAVLATSRLTSLSPGRCEENPVFAPLYEDVLVGQVASGRSCAGGRQCEEGAWCVLEQTGAVCRADVPLGADCGVNPCDLDVAYCDTQVQLGLLTHTCVAKRADGTSCSTQAQAQCASGFCDPASNRCAPRGLCDGV